PSLMPGGFPEAWEHLKPIFKGLAAKAPDGLPCCECVGTAVSGHFIKMVHNGIKYGDLQLICEAFHLMSKGLGIDFTRMVEPMPFLPVVYHGTEKKFKEIIMEINLFINNLGQAHRDYYGAHCYQLLSNPGIALHTNWTGKGRRITSNAYSA
uniref:phosphogluconate dehydrogenase (NADP(+)-dependent, decarboxylating) n=1 Tax=Meloidogyne floridensis TaxID=298350 RepID=A0A915NQA1_9BILA